METNILATSHIVEKSNDELKLSQSLPSSVRKQPTTNTLESSTTNKATSKSSEINTKKSIETSKVVTTKTTTSAVPSSKHTSTNASHYKLDQLSRFEKELLFSSPRYAKEKPKVQQHSSPHKIVTKKPITSDSNVTSVAINKAPVEVDSKKIGHLESAIVVKAERHQLSQSDSINRTTPQIKATITPQ